MSTVESINFYFDLKGISEDVTLAQSGSDSWDLVREYAGMDSADNYGSAFIFARNGEVLNIWGIADYTPWNDSSVDLIYSERARNRAIQQHKAMCKQCGEYYPHDKLSKGYCPTCFDDDKALIGNHYIVQSGMHGYLPESSYTVSNYDGAVDHFADEFELSDSAIEELRQYGMVDIDETNSNMDVSQESSLWYVSIDHCDCDDPSQHDDS